MRSSDLKFPITIQKVGYENNSKGVQVAKKTDLIKCRAKINGVSTKEYIQASQINAQNDLTFEVRYCKVLSRIKPQTTIIAFEGNEYDVKSIDDFMLQHKTLVIRAECKNGH